MRLLPKKRRRRCRTSRILKNSLIRRASGSVQTSIDMIDIEDDLKFVSGLRTA